MSDWKRVVKVAEEFKKSTERIDILINDAGRGIMTYALPDYGVDRHMAVNHLGLVILTSHLLPLLKTAEEGNCPYRGTRLECASSYAFGLQIQIPGRTEPRSRSKRPIWAQQNSCGVV